MPDTFISAATATEMLTQHTIDEQEPELLPARCCLACPNDLSGGPVADKLALLGSAFGWQGAFIGYAVGCALEPVPVS
jgi:hypothetical protein